ncbi:MAG TPA: DUF3333 domain-containing protein, partial [Thermodesulfovibrionia bacterium]|nr:DUF3333 domain-containing protein [Thermodesulfovibrionia bacterium]
METTNNKTIDLVNSGLAKRYRAERRFKLLGLSAIIASLMFLLILFVGIFKNGYTAFFQTHIQLMVYFDPEVVGQKDQAAADYPGLVKKAIRQMFPEVQERREKKQLDGLVSSGASFQLQRMVSETPNIIGNALPVWVMADDEVDMLIKGHVERNVPESERRLSDKQLAWIDKLGSEGKIQKKFNITFFTGGDSREPELAGILGAVAGSFFTLLITLVLSFPIGVAAAVYLEEFAPKNKITDFIEVNINNLAAVPSIVFGLLGLAVFLNFFGLPRSAPLVGGLVLT